MTSYFVLWIPVVQKGNLKIINRNLADVVLKDLPDVQELHIQGGIDTSTYNIKLEYWSPGEAKRNYILKCTEKHPTGFIAYSVEVDDDATDFVSVGLNSGFHKSYYHYIKGFFHNHIHHDKSEDSLLACYFSKTPISFSNKQTFKDIVDSYLDCYIQKLKGNISEINNHLSDILDEISHGKNVTRNIKFIHSLIKNCYRVRGELGYCRFLSNTNINDSSKEKRKELKAVCAEFDNSLDNLLFWYNHYVSLVSYTAGGKSLKWGIVGAILGISSLMVTAVLEIRNSNQLSNERQLNYINRADSIQNECLNNKIERLSNKIDSLYFLIKRPISRDSMSHDNKRSK
ncbi:MAG: hypothetical protein K2N13_04975 [Paraprevotella sp.]|nr:hypothetical protein [Paraprevotella sp.]